MMEKEERNENKEGLYEKKLLYMEDLVLYTVMMTRTSELGNLGISFASCSFILYPGPVLSIYSRLLILYSATGKVHDHTP